MAATRARDLLVVPALGDGPFQDGWLGPLDDAIYPKIAARRDASPAPGCPPFGRDSVVDRPDGDPGGSDNVAPGLYWLADDAAGGKAKVLPFHSDILVPDPGPPVPGYPVVWWDPNSPTLRLGVEAKFGIRQAELLSKDTPAPVVEQDLARYHAWRERRDRTVSDAATPSLRVLTVTELAERLVANQMPAPTERDEPEVVELTHTQARPSGRRFGALVHSVLAVTPLDATAEQVDEYAKLEGRMLGATDTEVTSAAAVATTALADPIL